MFRIKQMISMSMTIKLGLEKKIEMCLFLIGEHLYGTLCFALVFAFSSFWHLCFRSYLPGSSFLMSQLVCEITDTVLGTSNWCYSIFRVKSTLIKVKFIRILEAKFKKLL